MIELVFAIAVGALLVAVAANLARWGTRQAGRGEEQNGLNQRARLLRNQLRGELELAGLGSTGAIAVPGGVAFWNNLTVATPAGYAAIPAVRGGDNLAGGGTPPLVPGTDALQIVAADSSTRRRTLGAAPGGASSLPLENAPGMDCPQFPLGTSRLVYISDHSAPNGAGRTHLAVIDGLNPATVTGTLQFTIAPGSDVMCAQIVTYWVECRDATAGCPLRWLRRNVLDPTVAAGTQLGGATSPIYITPPPTADSDVVSPGIVDFQVAYSFSSEIAGRGTAESGRWAYDAVGTLDTSLTATPIGWFEARQVRISLLLRSLREVDDKRGQTGAFSIATTLLENRPAASAADVAIPINYGRQLVTTSAVLTNLRYFDFSGSQGLAAEPY